MKIIFFRTPKPRQYVHKPIYYDPAKEAHEERLERVRKEQETTDSSAPFKSSIKRGSFRKFRYDTPDETSQMHRDRRMSNIRLIIIVVVLFIVALLLYFTSSNYLAL